MNRLSILITPFALAVSASLAALPLAAQVSELPAADQAITATSEAKPDITLADVEASLSALERQSCAKH